MLNSSIVHKFLKVDQSPNDSNSATLFHAQQLIVVLAIGLRGNRALPKLPQHPQLGRSIGIPLPSVGCQLGEVRLPKGGNSEPGAHPRGSDAFPQRKESTILSQPIREEMVYTSRRAQHHAPPKPQSGEKWRQNVLASCENGEVGFHTRASPHAFHPPAVSVSGLLERGVGATLDERATSL